MSFVKCDEDDLWGAFFIKQVDFVNKFITFIFIRLGDFSSWLHRPCLVARRVVSTWRGFFTALADPRPVVGEG
jgi:hypothetical protein